MNYSIRIDQINATAWGLNMTEAGAFDYLYTVPTWADPVTIKGEIFYFVARQKMCQDIPLVVSKEDTAYRILKSLSEKGVLNYMKFGMKDCIQITALGKGWNSEKNPSNPAELGKKSESTRKIFRNSSEKNPTYLNTIYLNTNLSENKVVENEFSTVTLIDEVDETLVEIHHVPEYFDTEQITPTPQVAPPPRPKAKKETPAEDADFVFQVITYLNEQTEQNFQPGGKQTTTLVLGNKNYRNWTLEDFKLVIDFKKSEWLHKDNLRQYLRPSTLFSAGHAEEYLQAAKLWKKKPVATKPGVVPLFRQDNFANPDRSKFKF